VHGSRLRLRQAQPECGEHRRDLQAQRRKVNLDVLAATVDHHHEVVRVTDQAAAAAAPVRGAGLAHRLPARRALSFVQAAGEPGLCQASSSADETVTTLPILAAQLMPLNLSGAGLWEMVEELN